MNNAYIAVLACLMTLKLVAVCENVHCRFEYMGASSVEGVGKDEFMSVPALGGSADRYFERECRAFRELNWHLAQLEFAFERRNKVAVTNAVRGVSRLIDEYEVFLANQETGELRVFPQRLRMMLLERIEYALARIVLGAGRNEVSLFIDELLPDAIIDASKSIASWHSIKTFKQMLLIAAEIENYREREECLPLNLDMLKLPEAARKCACGRDIEYEQHAGIWVLRSRCESYDGGLKFDEYIPTIYQQRKLLDLCLSSTFNEKRAALFKGEILCPDDNRLSCQIIHDMHRSGVHPIKFASPSAGTGRIIPLSEQAERNSKCTKTEDSVVE